MMSVIHKSSITHYNKRMTMRTTTNKGKKQKFSRELREESVAAL